MAPGLTYLYRMEKRLDIVAIGECMVEFAELENGLYLQSYAGDTLNTLFYASRLGLRTGYVSGIGDDPYSQGIIEALDRDGIERIHVKQVKGSSNGTYFVLDNQGRKDYHFLRKYSAATRMLEVLEVKDLAEYINSSCWLHLSLTSIGIQQDKEQFFDLLGSIEGVNISFDANYRASVWRDAEDARIYYERMLPLATVLFVTDTDHQALYGETDFVDAIKRYQSFGVPRFAYRMGEKGSVLFDGKATMIPICEANVLDTTGAGDSFNAGFLYSLRNGRSFAECGKFATACAATAIEERGGMAQGFSKQNVMIKLQEAATSE